MTGAECQWNMVQFQAKHTHHEKEKALDELKYIKPKCEAFLDTKVVNSTEWPKGHLEEKCSMKIKSFLVVLKKLAWHSMPLPGSESKERVGAGR